MSHWNFGRAGRGQTVVVVICSGMIDDASEPVSAVYAIPTHMAQDAKQDEIGVADGDDYIYIDAQECAKA